MKNTLKIMGIIGLTALNTCHATDSAANTAPLTKAEVLLADQLAERLKIAGGEFKKNEDGEIKEINAGNNNINNSNGDLKDTPNAVGTETFMAPSSDGGRGMICFNEKTGIIMTAADSSLVGTAFDSALMQQITSSFNDDGKTVIHYSTSIPNHNDSKHNIQENMVLVAWNETALTGANKKGMICTVSAPAPTA